MTILIKKKNIALTIDDAKIKQSKIFKRYGFMLKLSFLYEEEKISFYQTFWLGNYKDYQNDSLRKNNRIWLLALDFFKAMDFPPKSYNQPEKVIGKTFNADIMDTGNGIYIAKVI